MKKLLFVFCSVMAFAAVISFDGNAGAETLGCQANPKVGDTCTKRVSIRLRKVESTGRDEFDRRFEPGAGWAIQDCETRKGERGRTGEVSGPSCVEVQIGTTTTSSSYVQSQANHVYETIGKLKGQAGNGAAQIFGALESKVRSEFSDLERTASVHQSKNYGVQIRAWVAVQGGCRDRVFKRCVNWGPGGSLDTDVLVRLVYVGTNQDINQVAQKYVAEANLVASNSKPVEPTSDLSQVIVSSYQAAFGRNPSQDEINYWLGRSRQETIIPSLVATYEPF
jgi:hypothetical protein